MALLSCPKSPHRLERLLNSLPKTLDETYKRMLQNIDDDNKDDAIRMLTLLCCAARPLAVSEVVDALAIELSRNPGLDTTRRLEDGANELQRLCPGLTEIYFREYGNNDDDEEDDDYPYDDEDGDDEDGDDEDGDDEDGDDEDGDDEDGDDEDGDDEDGDCPRPMIRLAHFSVQEYLESGRIVQPEIAIFAVNMQKAHALMASVCLTLLLDPQILAWEPYTDEVDLLRQADAVSPLVRYAGAFWPEHFRSSQEDHHVERQVMQLLQDEKALPTSILLFDSWSLGEMELSNCTNIDYLETPPLYFASALGLGSIVAKLCTSYPSVGESISLLPGTAGTGPVNEDCGDGRTALWVAAYNGHEEIVRILLRHGADVDTRGEGVTALFKASARDYKKVAQILLENGASPHFPDSRGLTALQNASGLGYETIVRFLLAEGADINAEGPGGTALQIASSLGNEAIIRLLLSEGAAAGINADGLHGTALQRASWGCHEAIVRLLLAEGADINLCGRQGTALHRASWGSHEEVVRLLLAEGADVNAEGPDGTALQVVSISGHEATVRLLLAEGADINVCGRQGTALHMASSRGNVGVVRILLEHSADPSLLNEDGETALDVANRRFQDHKGNGTPKLWLKETQEVIEMLEIHTKAASKSSAPQSSPTRDGGLDG